MVLFFVSCFQKFIWFYEYKVNVPESQDIWGSHWHLMDCFWVSIVHEYILRTKTDVSKGSWSTQYSVKSTKYEVDVLVHILALRRSRKEPQAFEAILSYSESYLCETLSQENKTGAWGDGLAVKSMHALLFRRTWLWFQASKGWITAVCFSNSKGYNIVF